MTIQNISDTLYGMPKTLRTIVICTAALMLNFLSVFLFYDLLHLPLFMDTIFTVAVVFYCGLLPGLAVQVLYNIINSLIWFAKLGRFDGFMMLYAICGILIVISTWLIARNKNEFKISPVVTILYLVLIALISSVCSVVAGGIIDYFHLKWQNIPDMMNPIKIFTESFVHQHFNLLASCILAQIPISFADRLIATFAGYGFFRLAERLFDGKRQGKNNERN